MTESVVPKSKYLSYFVEHKAELSKSLSVIGDVLVCERIKFPEKRVGGLFIPDSKKVMEGGFTCEVPEFYRILLTGSGYYDDDTGTDEPIDAHQGDIIHVGKAGVKIWSSFPNLETVESDVLCLTRYTDCLLHFRGERAFNDFLVGFNTSHKS